MTREEFMEEAQKEIDQILFTHKNWVMNLVMKAWEEGKKNAEVSGIEDIVKEAIEKIHKQKDDIKKAIDYLDWHFEADDGTADKDAQKAWYIIKNEINREAC